MKSNWNFKEWGGVGGRGVNPNTSCGGRYGYLLEQHNNNISILPHIQALLTFKLDARGRQLN